MSYARVCARPWLGTPVTCELWSISTQMEHALSRSILILIQMCATVVLNEHLRNINVMRPIDTWIAK